MLYSRLSGFEGSMPPVNHLPLRFTTRKRNGPTGMASINSSSRSPSAYALAISRSSSTRGCHRTTAHESIRLSTVTSALASRNRLNSGVTTFCPEGVASDEASDALLNADVISGKAYADARSKSAATTPSMNSSTARPGDEHPANKKIAAHASATIKFLLTLVRLTVSMVRAMWRPRGLLPARLHRFFQGRAIRRARPLRRYRSSTYRRRA